MASWPYSENYSITCLDKPFRLQEIEVPVFLDDKHTKVVRMLALHTAVFTPSSQNIPLLLISVKRLSAPQSHIAARRINSTSNPINPSEIETATFRFVAKCLNQLPHLVSPFLPVLLCNVEVTYPIFNFPFIYTAGHNRAPS